MGLESVTKLVDDALKGAKAPAQPDEDLPRLDIPSIGLGVLDRRQAHLTDEDRMDVVRSNMKALGAAGVEVSPLRVRYVEELEELCFGSTQGLDLESRSSRFSLTAQAQVRENSARMVSRTMSCRSFADACSRPLGADVARSVMQLCTAASMPDGPCPVVLDQAVIGLLLPLLLPAFDDARLESGKSFLSDKMGSAHGSSLVHIIDDATVPGGLQTRAFDRRGIPPVSIPLWVEGVPTGRYLGTTAAVAKGLRPSGHEGLDGALWPGNVIVRPGSRSRNMLFPDLGQLVLCTELVDSKVNLSTGALRLCLRSFSADASGTHGYIGDLWMETDVGALLGSVIHMASDQERHGFIDTPTWIIEGPWFQA
jgi:predicted Zn-dependent protease